MRVVAPVALTAMTLLLCAWRLSDNGVGPWHPKGKAVVRTPDGASHVIRSAFCSFGRHGGVRLRFGGKRVTTDVPSLHLVATRRREGNPAILDVWDGVLDLPPKWAAVPAGTAHVQPGLRRGTFILWAERDDVGTGKPQFTGSFNCG